MTHSYTYILETIQPKTLKILTFKSISKMHFKCNLCFFMCLWCHYHLLSTEFRHRACFHTGAASEETPHKPQHRQGTLSNYSPGQYSNNQGLQTLGYTWVTFTHKHSPTGVTQTSYTQKGFHNRTQNKMVPGRIPGGPTSLPGTWQEPAPLPRALPVLLQKHHGDWPQGPPSPQQDRPPGLNLSIWKDEMESENHNSLTNLNSAAGGKKSHPAFSNNLLHNVMICD